MKISIIVPIYNVHNYIEKCLDSIICQECDNYALECILVNDCTPDDSMSIIERKLRNYVGLIDFVIVNHEVNKGLSASRNTGVQHAKGDYVFFLDSDDRLEVYALKYMMDALIIEKDKNSNVDVIIGNTFICKDGKPSMSYKSDTAFFLDNSTELALRGLLNRELYHIACNKFVKRDLLLKNNISFKEGIIDEDLLWSYYVFNNSQGVLVIPQITYIYEDNPGSIMNTTSKRIVQRIMSRITICNMILDFPPRFSYVEYYMYVFYIMTRAINLYEQNKTDNFVREYSKDLVMLRNRLLKEVFHKRLILMYVFFLTAKKPLYALNNFRWYRRYYDKIANFIVVVSNSFKRMI